MSHWKTPCGFLFWFLLDPFWVLMEQFTYRSNNIQCFIRKEANLASSKKPPQGSFYSLDCHQTRSWPAVFIFKIYNIHTKSMSLSDKCWTTPKARPAADVFPALLSRRRDISQVRVPPNKTCLPAVSVLRSQPRHHGALLRDHHVRPAGVPDLLAAGGDGLLLQEDL